jgi:hypothetical protein
MGQIQRTANGSSFYTAVLGTNQTDFEVIVTSSLDQFIPHNQGNTMPHIGVVLRYQDNNNYYKVFADGTNLTMIERVNGNNTTLGNKPAFSALPDTLYTIRFQVVGSKLRAKIWPMANTEPTAWMITANDNTFQTGRGGLRPQLIQNVMMLVTSFVERAPVNP